MAPAIDAQLKRLTFLKCQLSCSDSGHFYQCARAVTDRHVFSNEYERELLYKQILQSVLYYILLVCVYIYFFFLCDHYTLLFESKFRNVLLKTILK